MTSLPDPFDKYAAAAATLTVGLLLGLALTAATLRSGYGFQELEIGPWRAWPQLGEADVDPYARAALARRGVAPLGRSEGLTLLAATDSSGAPLFGGCDYRIIGPVPASRFWTIGLVDSAGAPLPNVAERYHFTSSEILRRVGGAFEIAVARNARAGNWLSPGVAERFVIALRLYDSQLDPWARLEPAVFPSIVRLSCA